MTQPCRKVKTTTLLISAAICPCAIAAVHAALAKSPKSWTSGPIDTTRHDPQFLQLYTARLRDEMQKSGHLWGFGLQTSRAAAFD
nr:hypothetical protein CFP56_13278 [Quercus suber]